QSPNIPVWLPSPDSWLNLNTNVVSKGNPGVTASGDIQMGDLSELVGLLWHLLQKSKLPFLDCNWPLGLVLTRWCFVNFSAVLCL
ncbi:hypothetical protein V2J09_006658, partial [Rumex salicifolius]